MSSEFDYVENSYCPICIEHEVLCQCDPEAKTEPDEYERWIASRRIARPIQNLISKIIEEEQKKKLPTDYKIESKNRKILRQIEREKLNKDKKLATAKGTQTRRR